MSKSYDLRGQHNLFDYWIDADDKSSVYGAILADSASDSLVEGILRYNILSPFAHYWRCEGRSFLYHSLTQQKFCGTLSLCDILDFLALHPGKRGRLFPNDIFEGYLPALIPLLMRLGFLLDAEVNPSESLAVFQKTLSLMEEEPSILYLFLSHHCNLCCEYCLKSRGAGASPVRISMDRETSLRALSVFGRLRNRGHGRARIVLYGGEPLLNMEVLRFAVNEIRTGKRLYDSLEGEAHIELFTNGTLIDEESVDLISHYGVYPVISLDGMDTAHNRCRKGPRGGRSFGAALRGYRALMKRGIVPAISCTVSAHTIDSLVESVSYFVDELEAREIRFYPVKGLPGESTLEISPQCFFESVKKIYPILRRNRVIDNVCHPLLHRLSHERINFKSCSAYGGQLSVMPDGSIGPCINLAEEYRCLWGNVHDDSIERSIVEHGSRELFQRRSPFFRKDCRSCPAIALCGGGCIHQGFVRYDDYMGMDDLHCAVFKSLLPWGVERLFEEMPWKQRRESCQ